ncbi:LEAF RUST 10 DISEASE-RESISTANCE LOCUS RECEPTOR-LIKE PROTEIN KINASE-like 2.4 [Prosopis cineraria]|uniref:LEAF RUST 10 DISEASE-RESISTANCE LOCUS RECEPTOR-LIKE PROTEIN KINASE-like 2.4 n=1 Tax=Prosopis cineraria TaxID=364024 RepID=UPI00240F86E5|nr:LEAF RUST 10 DISEASE-RESISTANCE LOCUS RECEPTOR-LIKE PROTEIN KINASE-like 2.4 [Prosopis cineraria]
MKTKSNLSFSSNLKLPSKTENFKGLDVRHIFRVLYIFLSSISYFHNSQTLLFSVYVHIFPGPDEMNHSLAPCFIFFLLLLLLFIITVGADDRFTNCSSRISCGTVNNVGYPFWGENRAEYCGQPGFQLACQDNTPKLISNPITYRILKFSLSDQSLTVVRDDYWQNSMPKSVLKH